MEKSSDYGDLITSTEQLNQKLSWKLGDCNRCKQRAFVVRWGSWLLCKPCVAERLAIQKVTRKPIA